MNEVVSAGGFAMGSGYPELWHYWRAVIFVFMLGVFSGIVVNNMWLLQLIR
jgi:hypothetical protein